ncbi:Calx-beta domain-containing protein [Chamaesiphon minutus]|uniref:Calx-beta domain-containing protein n=1 Tax=Chamaesiphon minutus (strain ATCC 27169 / PCC 6605) TaxID=1173020 RepID=K9UPK5_CHAP6|nr:Calx-beta domain-containing protein [Chamaesiphon minutus]AFY96341.1 Calx-beta domain-containing protein [Chamaesiphon minutus PCC 6605]
MARLKTTAGDGGLDVLVDNTGSFSGAAYDPVGAKTASSTTYESDLAFRIGTSGARKFISELATNITSPASIDTTSTTSRFLVSGLQFELIQTVSDLNKNGQRTGSGLTQAYQITNPTSTPISFELVRYFDGDLQFDGSIADKGGRIARNGRDILFETDSGDNPFSPTTFVGITANGGTRLTSDRFEIGQFSSLRSRILAGNPLSNAIQGDTNGDSFIDSAPYDVTPAFRNVFVLAPGATTTYITETLFGSGVPSQVSLPETITVVASDPTAFENIGSSATFTLNRANAKAGNAITVNYTLSGRATTGTDYVNTTGSVTFLAGQETATVKIEPIADNIPEGLESVVLTIDDGFGYNLSDRSKQARITIADDSSQIELPLTVSIASASFNEGSTGTKSAVFNVTLNKPSEVDVTVDVSTVDGTAIAGSDYTALNKTTVYFAPGETTQQITVDITGDRDLEADETFTLNLSDPTNADLGDRTAIGTILDDDTPLSLSVSDADAAETKTGETPNPGQFIITRGGDLNKSLSVRYTLSGTSINGADYQRLAGTSIFAVGSDKAVVDIQAIDDKIYEGTENVTLSFSTDDYTLTGASSGTISIADKDPEKPQLLEPVKNLLTVEGGSVNTLLKFTKVPQTNNELGEISAFVVDDDLGRINGIKPGENGYVAAAIERATSIFSSLGNSAFDRQYDNNSQRYLNITQGDRIQFLAITNETLDSVKTNIAAGKPAANIVFSLPDANPSNTTPVRFTLNSTNNNYDIAFKDLVVRVEAVDNYNLQGGTDLQGNSQGQVIDLRSYAGGSVIFDMRAIGDAAYSNFIGLYEVEDESGTLANGLKPGDAGYAEAAIKSAVLRTRFTSQADTNLSVAGGKILAPVVVANGTFDNFLKQNPNNNADGNIHAYFNYLGANTDKVDHFRLLGDNKFGIEDLYGGGDRDYNDLVFQITIKN